MEVTITKRLVGVIASIGVSLAILMSAGSANAGQWVRRCHYDPVTYCYWHYVCYYPQDYGNKLCGS